MKKIFNIVGFQICWWLCVLFSTKSYSFIGPLFMSIYLIIHFIYISNNKIDVKLILIVGLIGTFFDSLFVVFDIFSYSGSFIILSDIAPLWITSMWVGFATTINYSLDWINKNYYLAFIMGFIFGPLSYVTGREFGAIQFLVSDILGLSILALAWGLIIPMIVYINRSLIGMRS